MQALFLRIAKEDSVESVRNVYGEIETCKKKKNPKFLFHMKKVLWTGLVWFRIGTGGELL
jgi:hypothetical protein